MNRISVLIVDDHALVRTGLRATLLREPDFDVVGEAATLLEAGRLVVALRPAVVTLDLSLPDSSGLSGIQYLLQLQPDARLLVVSMHDDPAYVRTALSLGAAGFVTKSAADGEFTNAIRAVAEGRVVVDVGGRGGDTLLATNPARSPDALSAREMEVLKGVALGHTNQRLADALGLSVKTVESYRARLMRKLGLRERSDLVRVAIELKLL